MLAASTAPGEASDRTHAHEGPLKAHQWSFCPNHGPSNTSWPMDISKSLTCFACRLSSLGACLKELRLHDNLIRGPLLPGLAGLSTLHTLDLRGNRITSVEVG